MIRVTVFLYCKHFQSIDVMHFEIHDIAVCKLLNAEHLARPVICFGPHTGAILYLVLS